jgi:hypothetical protein
VVDSLIGVISLPGIVSFGTEDFSLYPRPFVFLYIGTGTDISIHEQDFEVPVEVTEAILQNWIKIGSNYFP